MISLQYQVPSNAASLVSTRAGTPYRTILFVISVALVYSTRSLYHTLYPARPVSEPIPGYYSSPVDTPT